MQHALTVNEHAERVVAAESEAELERQRRLEGVVQVDDRVFLVAREQLQEVHDLAGCERLEHLPRDRLAAFAGVRRLQIDAILGRVDEIEAFAVGVVERSDVVPLAFEIRELVRRERGPHRIGPVTLLDVLAF